MVAITAAAMTHPGLVRRTNEDSLLVTGRLVAVADGLGGHAAGEVASRIAVDRMRLLADVPDLSPDDIEAAVADANRLIVEAARTQPGCEGMGTTLSGVAVVRVGDHERCVVFNVGDSRVYRLAGDHVAQVTVDHSEVEELRSAGRLTSAEAARHPMRHVITRCLGSVPAPAADLWAFPPGERERFLVCTDGLTGELDDTELAAVLAAHAEPGPAASALLERALSAGGHDNIAVIVLDLDGSDTDLDAAGERVGQHS